MPTPHAHHHAHHPIDIHAHWYPQAWLDLLSTRGPAEGVEWKMVEGKGPQFKVGYLATGPAGPRYVDLDARLEAMDEQGAHERNPHRFIGLATLQMQFPEQACREVERAAKLPGVRGFYISTRVNDRELSDPAFFPVYERIAALKLPLFLHPVYVIDHERLTAHYLTNLLGNPFEAAIAAAHLIFGGVLDRFPDLDVVLPHAGGAFPWLVGRLNRGWEKRADLKHINQAPLDYLRRFHYDTVGYSDTVVEYLVKNVGADRVMMGSDYCFPIAYEQPAKNVTDNPFLTSDQHGAILEGNARRLLRI